MILQGRRTLWRFWPDWSLVTPLLFGQRVAMNSAFSGCNMGAGGASQGDCVILNAIGRFAARVEGYLIEVAARRSVV